tara:strand:+ start:1246 stop:1515 length:270 start_codon:yes stop_codon:yes gene_type:complete
MKKILGIVVIIFFFSASVHAAPVKVLSNNTTVNSLLKQGYSLFSTNTIGYSVQSQDGYGNKVGIFYNLIKGNEIITCLEHRGDVECYKP